MGGLFFWFIRESIGSAFALHFLPQMAQIRLMDLVERMRGDAVRF